MSHAACRVIDNESLQNLGLLIQLGTLQPAHGVPINKLAVKFNSQEGAADVRTEAGRLGKNKN